MNIDMQNAFIAGLASGGLVEDGGYSGSVTFMVENTEYAKASVNGAVSVAEPTQPPIPSGYQSFLGWNDAGGQKMTFPYAPNGDETASAVFSNYRTDITYDTAGQTVEGGTKTNNGIMAAGYCTRTAVSSQRVKWAAFIGETAESCAISNASRTGSFERGGKTWYYSLTPTLDLQAPIKAWLIGDYNDGYVNASYFVINQDGLNRLVDYYTGVIS